MSDVLTSNADETHTIVSGDGLDDLIARLEAEWQSAVIVPDSGTVVVPVLDARSGVSGVGVASIAPESTVERRQARRITPEKFARDLRITLAGATEAKTVNLSATGVLTETTHRLCPGRTIDLFLRFNGARRVLRATVVRCVVHAVSPQPLFRAALQFQDPYRLPECDT